jgi:hypothetical protein
VFGGGAPARGPAGAGREASTARWAAGLDKDGALPSSDMAGAMPDLSHWEKPDGALAVRGGGRGPHGLVGRAARRPAAHAHGVGDGVTRPAGAAPLRRTWGPRGAARARWGGTGLRETGLPASSPPRDDWGGPFWTGLPSGRFTKLYAGPGRSFHGISLPRRVGRLDRGTRRVRATCAAWGGSPSPTANGGECDQAQGKPAARPRRGRPPAALVNFRALAHALWTTRETLQYIEGSAQCHRFE